MRMLTYADVCGAGGAGWGDETVAFLVTIPLTSLPSAHTHQHANTHTHTHTHTQAHTLSSPNTHTHTPRTLFTQDTHTRTHTHTHTHTIIDVFVRAILHAYVLELADIRYLFRG